MRKSFRYYILFTQLLMFYLGLAAVFSNLPVFAQSPQSTQDPIQIPGDTNADGKVDEADYQIWLTNYNLITTSVTYGNFNPDNKVNSLDFAIWRKFFLLTYASPTPQPSPTPFPSASLLANCIRPYTVDSPWNTPIPENVNYHPDTSLMVATITQNLTSRVVEFTYPVFKVDANTPRKNVTLKSGGLFKRVYNNNTQMETHFYPYTVQNVPIPDNAAPAGGSDAQIIFWDQTTGDEWEFWQATVDAIGNWSAKNTYLYNTNWSAVPPVPFSRGAGIPYLAGLIQKCEIDQGVINHAIAFAYNYPCAKVTSNPDRCVDPPGYPYFVYPATRSDGNTINTGYNFPEGTRLQLVASQTEVDDWCNNFHTAPLEKRACKIIGTTLRTFGMYIIDESGRPKIYAEHVNTADWTGILDDNTPSAFPINRFKVVNF